MKSIMVKRFLAVALAGAALITGSSSTFAAASVGCCTILPAAPGNTVTAFVTDYFPDQFTADSTFTITITNAGPIPTNTYAAWCVDASTVLDPRANNTILGTVYFASLYSTCDPAELALIPDHPSDDTNFPGVGPPPTTTLATWHEINYILNHRAGYFYWDVQVAINTLVGGPPPGPSPPFPPVHPNDVQAILNAAISNAPAWQPQCGDKVGILFVVDPEPEQILILEVPCCNVSFTKCPTDLALGCNPPAASIPDCTSPVDTNVVNAVSCCGLPVTVSCSKSDTTIGCMTFRTFTYTADDGFGHTATCLQTVTWTTDTTAPVFISVPTGTNLGCNPASLPTSGSIKALVQATNGCGSVTTINVTNVDSGTPCAMSRNFIITATDGCKNVATTNVLYTWKNDTNAPVFTSLPAGTNLGCNPTLPTSASIQAKVTATDNCGSVNISVTNADTGTPCGMTRTFTITAVDGCGNATTNTVAYTYVIDTTGPMITCPPDVFLGKSNNTPPPGHCTYTQGGWGACPSGNNPGTILASCFSKVYPGGSCQIGIPGNNGYSIKFTSCSAIAAFLPSGGTPKALNCDASNPTSNCGAGVFAGQVLALQLNCDFSNCGSVAGFGGCISNLVVNDPTSPCKGKTVGQILAIANCALGGGSTSGCTISQLNDLCTSLNEAFDSCQSSCWAVKCLLPCTNNPTTNVVSTLPSQTGYPIVTDGCGSTPVVTYSDSVAAGSCPGSSVITRTWKAVDACKNTNTCTQKITIGCSPSPLNVDCPCGTGQVCVAYSSALTASGGVPPYKFSIVAGSLPTGLTLNPTNGAITGFPTAGGTFPFTAQVMDSSGAANSVDTTSCSITIKGTTTTTLGAGDTATIGFWHNSNGQALIDSLNGGPSSTALANALASYFPYLYGAGSSNNLTGKKNTDVAVLFLKFFNVSGQKTDAQILAGALACYVTDSVLAGYTGASYGFNISPAGTGAKTYNVGSLGTAIGLMNNTSYTVLQLLQQANLDKKNGTFNANAFNTIFDGINQGGDIN